MSEFVMVDGEVPIRVAVEGSGPLVLLVHGFPESWYSWRHQLAPIAEAGFTAAAIDVRGYGGSGKPEPVEAYGLEQIGRRRRAASPIISAASRRSWSGTIGARRSCGTRR